MASAKVDESKVSDVEEDRKAVKRDEPTEDEDHSDNNSKEEVPEDSGAENSVDGGDKQQVMRREHGPIVLDRGMTGTVKWFSIQKGYGFIRIDNTEDEIFMHASSIVRSIQRPLVLADNQKVEFDIIMGPKGEEAACVSGPNGMRVGRILGYGPGAGRFSHNNGPPRMNGRAPRRSAAPIKDKPKEDSAGRKGDEVKAGSEQKELVTNKDANNNKDKEGQQPKGKGNNKRSFRRRQWKKQQQHKKEDEKAAQDAKEKETEEEEEEGEEGKQPASPSGDKENRKPSTGGTADKEAVKTAEQQ